jgi:tetratricopeptide (TPR) repeat protein
MKVVLLAGALLISLARISAGQAFDPNTPDGSMVGSIQKETDPSKKQAMLEDFVQKFPSSHLAGWAWGQLQAAYLQAQQYDKAISAGEKSLAVDPDSIDVAYNNLKAAEAKNDPDAVMKWSAETSRAARQELAGSKQGAPDQARIDYAKQIDTYSEYSIYAMSAKTTDPAKIISLTESLEQRDPQSAYLSKSYGRYLNALRQSGQAEKAGTAAQHEAERDPANEDCLVVAADYSMRSKQYDKALEYSKKLAEVMQSKAKPEESSEADWSKKKQTLLPMAYWIQGVTYNAQNHFAEADKILRNALPLVNNDDRLQGMVLFQLGVADFQLGKVSKNTAMMRQALKYSQRSAALKSPVQTDAQNNVKAISKALGVPPPHS